MNYLQKFAYSWSALGRVGKFIWQHKYVSLYMLAWLFLESTISLFSLIQTVRTANWGVLANYVPQMVTFTVYAYDLITLWLFVFCAVCATRYTFEALSGRTPSFWGSIRLPRSLWVGVLLWVLFLAIVVGGRLFFLIAWLVPPISDICIRLIWYLCTPYVLVFMVAQRVSVWVALVRAVKFLWNHLLESSSLFVLLLISVPTIILLPAFSVSLYFAGLFILNWCLFTTIITLPVIVYREKNGAMQV